ncbi:ead/Ea22-like family protein [Enterobacter sichuanensis]|uniref:ead/Ea22-like family protein n=1 Tax=Enterobacter sichuanensis TaxID=2071710 RepID=UPI002B1F9023|nr:ead/Ea22-like family protein [Enterobacter sichuanensis]MEA5168164.1 ead/Ea22-like family protein [Enterobacter sichuanensis]
MSNIDKRVLREAADSVLQKYGSEWFETGSQLCTVHKSKIKLIAAANPATVLALLDELEAAKKRIAEMSESNRLLCADSMIKQDRIAELEAAPPAPVGEGETAVMPDYPGHTMTQRECYQAGKKAGLAEAVNSPVMPDGWVACSERMPEDGEKVLTSFRGGMRTAVCKVVDVLGHKIFVDELTLFNGVPADYWQPLPAAPQQEAK